MTDDALTLEEFGNLIGGRVESIAPITETALQITKEYLEREIASLEGQRAQAMAVAHGAEGAMQAFRSLIARMEKPEPEANPDGNGKDAG